MCIYFSLQESNTKQNRNSIKQNQKTQWTEFMSDILGQNLEFLNHSSANEEFF
jgi:hypothetical protein